MHRFEYVPFHYQKGNGLDQFKGYKYYPGQRGSGWGDVFRYALRFLAPVGVHTAASFLASMNQRHDTGETWKSAAYQALGDAKVAGVQAIGEQLKRTGGQSGSGKQPKRKKRTKKRKGAKRSKRSIHIQSHKKRKQRHRRKKNKRHHAKSNGTFNF